MEPHLYLNRGKKRVLLVRYFDKLHFVNLDHRMSYKVRPWFLEKPRTEEEMDEKGLVRESIPLKDIRGVAAGGTGRGMVVQFYLKEGKKRYELYKDCDLPDMSALFAGLESFDPPKKDSSWHDPRMAKQDPKQRNILWAIGWLLNLTAIITGVFIWAVGYEIPWLCWIALLCIPVSLLLYGFFPDYYNIFSEKPKYGQKKGVRSLVAPLICPLGMILGAMNNYAWFEWWKGWLFGAVGVAALAAILYFLTPVFKSWDQILAVAVLGLLLSIGPALTLNVIAETVPARNLRTEVVDKENHHSNKGGDYYELIVMLDGEKTGIPVGGETYRTTEIGEMVTVEYHAGGLWDSLRNAWREIIMYEKMTDEWILEHQDKYRYWKFEKLRLGLIIASLVFGLAYILLRRQSLALTLLCLLIPILCVCLDICFPTYFTLMHPKWEMNQDIRANRVSLVAPFFYSLGLLAVATHLNFHFTRPLLLFLSGLILAVMVTALFLLFLPECQRTISEAIIFLILMTAVGFGITGQANYWLDNREPEVVRAVVTEIDDNYSRHHMVGHSGVSNITKELLGVMYTCEITLPDGSKADFSMAHAGNVRIGDTAMVTHINGALGLECYTLGRIK